MSVVVIAGMAGLAIALGREVAELSFIAAVAIYDTILIWRRLRERAIRGAAVRFGSHGEHTRNRLVSVLAVLGAGLLAVSMLIGESVTAMDVVRMVGVALLALTAVLGGEGGSRLYEGGIRYYQRFVRWDSIGSFRCLEFLNTVVFEFQIKEPRWFANEVSVAVPRAEAVEANGWLAKRIPRLGHEDMRRIRASGV
jgi:hypothetical protein